MTTPTFYSDPTAVLVRTGIQPGDLGQDDDAALAAFLETLLAEVTDLMDRTMGRSYLSADPIPPGLGGIAADAASNAVREMVATRQTPVVRIDDFAVRVIQSNVLTPDVRERLRLYGSRAVVSVDLGQADISELISTDIDSAVFLTQDG